MTKTSGIAGGSTGGAEAAAGLGVEPLDLADHVGEILVVDAAGAAQRGKIAFGEQRQIGDQRRHRRVETVALDQLQRQAFGEVARENAGRLRASASASSTASTRASGGAEPLGDFLERSR